MPGGEAKAASPGRGDYYFNHPQQWQGRGQRFRPRPPRRFPPPPQPPAPPPGGAGGRIGSAKSTAPPTGAIGESVGHSPRGQVSRVWDIAAWCLEFVSDFEIRISDFFPGKVFL